MKKNSRDALIDAAYTVGITHALDQPEKLIIDETLTDACKNITDIDKKLLNGLIKVSTDHKLNYQIQMAPYIIFIRDRVFDYAKAQLSMGNISLTEFNNLAIHLRNGCKYSFGRPNFLFVAAGLVVLLDEPGQVTDSSYDRNEEIVYNSIGMTVYKIKPHDVEVHERLHSTVANIILMLTCFIDDRTSAKFSQKLSRQADSVSKKYSKFNFDKDESGLKYSANCKTERRRFVSSNYVGTIKNGALVFRSYQPQHSKIFE